MLDLGAADEWRVLLSWRGTPCAYLELPSPGATSGPAIVDAAIVRQADGPVAFEELVGRLRRRLGVPDVAPAVPDCSVVVCTHRRPRYVVAVLDALGRLDPPAAEILVVDNAPGNHDCRAEVERAGARYIREDQPGLDRARNAGLRAASGELVAFTDDDCVPATGWLSSLGALFADASVAAVTGPAFAYALDTPAQVRFEDQGGHRRGLRRRVFDWTELAPIAASRAGAGLNMIFRRSLLDRLGEVFPPELDSGTPTESGGDMYALYKVLRAGYRVVYDPATYVLHQHRPDARSLHRAIRGYGIGVSAVLTKLVVEERELAAPTTWYWLWWLYMDALRRRLMGRADPVEVRIGWDYLVGGLLGPSAWRQSRRSFGAGGAVEPRRAAPPADPAEPRPTPTLSVSVIITATRPGAAARCVEAVERIGVLEAILATPDREPALGVRNAAARKARGDLLLFLDADAVPDSACLAHHVRRHEAGGPDLLVVGCCRPDASSGGLAALWEARQRYNHFERKRMAAAMTFADVRSSNLSVRRSTFERLGGFDAGFEHFGREGFELGVRALEQGCRVAYEQRAVAVERIAVDVREALADARREGHGDALLQARHASVSPSLPSPRTALGRVLGGPRATRSAALVLTGLERLRARGLWVGLFQLARAAAYERGALAGGGRRPAKIDAVPPLRIELDSDEAIPPPSVAPPLLELSLGGTVVGTVRPTGGQWHAYLADEAASLVADRPHALPLEPRLAHEVPPPAWALAGTRVLFGPARQPGDARWRDELRASGAAVQLVDGEPDQHWAALDLAIRSSSQEVVALTLPGVTPAPAWLTTIAPALDGNRVAVTLGAGLSSGARPRPLYLFARRLLPTPYPTLGQPAQHLAIRRELYSALGGFDLTAAKLGPQAVVLDLVDRALDAGWVVAYRDVPGLDPTPPDGSARRRAAWARHRARGALMWRRARRLGGARGGLWLVRHGLLPLAMNLWRALRGGERRATLAAGTAVAFLSGCLSAAVDREDRDPGRAALASSAPKRPEPRVR
jgi:GT2 family glycosyltransferase